MKLKLLIVRLFWLCAISSSSFADSPPPHLEGSDDRIILPDPIPDPLEPVNRGLWILNEAAMKGVIKPSGKVYRLVVPQPFRMGISNIGRNLAYPRRVVNNLLQERWAGAGNESLRFLCNSVLGMGGFLDVASEFRIPVSEADFGQTLAKWGWEQNFYLMLPLAGPSSDRHAVGAAVDSAMNPLSYFSPYSYIPTGIIYNNLTDSVDAYVRRSDSAMDPYALLRYVTAIARKYREVDWELDGDQHAPSLQTLMSVQFGVRDPHFTDRGDTRKVQSAASGGRLPYTAWMQPNRSPIVYILPGIGAHRFSDGALGLAELLYEHGYSAVTISSTFNFEFIGNALSAAVPGYTPADIQDVQRVLALIDADLTERYPGRIGQRALVGYSMGGFHALMIAAQPARESTVRFDRYLAIDPPVHLLNAIEELDSFYQAALAWPAAERTDRIEELLVKVADIALGKLDLQHGIPLNETESKFLVGLAFRLNLRDLIFFTQMRQDLGVLDRPLNWWRREPAYRAIMDYSFSEYLDLFVAPYYKKRGIDLQQEETMRSAVDLRSFGDVYRGDPRVHAIANEDDILLSPEHVRWLRETFESRVTLFPNGGHLGNLVEEPVQLAILEHLEGLREPAGSAAISRSPGARREVRSRLRGAAGSARGF